MMIINEVRQTFDDLKLVSNKVNFIKLSISCNDDSYGRWCAAVVVNDINYYPLKENKEETLKKMNKQFPHLILIDSLFVNESNISYIEEDLTDNHRFYLVFGDSRHKVNIKNFKETFVDKFVKIDFIQFHNEIETLVGNQEQLILVNMKKYLKNEMAYTHYLHIFFKNENSLLQVSNKNKHNISFQESLNDYYKQKIILETL